MRKRTRTAGITVALSAACLLSACGADTSIGSTSTTTATTITTLTTTTSTSSATTTTSPATTAGGAILVVGDWGTGTAPEGAVAGAMQRYVEENAVTAVLTTGDNFYNDDAEFIMHPYAWMEDAGTEWWITWGNHDVETDGRVDLVNQTFANPPRWTVMEWGDVEIVILDSTQVDTPEQAEFLATTLSEGDEPTIVVFHHPPHSCESHSDTVDTQEAFVSMFDEQVFLVLNGHEHNYQRFEAGEVAFIVTGGGGAGLTEFSDCTTEGPAMLAGDVLHHFLALSQDEDGGLHIQAIDISGAVFDEITLDLP